MSIALFVPARLHSSRLPEKMLLDIEGRPALWYPLTRMKQGTRLPERYVVCTSTHPDDAKIADLAQSVGWDCFRGSEEDILDRYLRAAEHFHVEFMVNVDGDDLFCSEKHVDLLIERFRQTAADYIQVQGLPFSCAPVGVKIAALKRVVEAKEDSDTQGWGKYFTQSGLFRVETMVAEQPPHRSRFRLTLDYPEDLEFFRAVVRRLDPNHEGRLPFDAIMSFLDAHPEIAAISQVVSEQYWERFHREHGSYRMKIQS